MPVEVLSSGDPGRFYRSEKYNIADFVCTAGMAESVPVQFQEDRVPSAGMAEAVDEMVELYGGEIQSSAERERRFILPMRRGVAVAGGVECTLSWAVDDGDQATLTLVCNRDVDAPKFQRIALLAVGVIGALLFTSWPFFGKATTQMGTLAWVGGLLALTVYFLTLKRSSGGIAYDFLRRLAKRQRASGV